MRVLSGLRRSAALLIFASLSLTMTGCFGASSSEADTSSEATEEETEESRVEVQTLEEESLSLEFPEDWDEQDLSNHTIIGASGSVKDSRHHYQFEEKGETVAMLQYTAEEAEEPEDISQENLVDAIDSGFEMTAQAGPEEIQFMTQDKGLGCFYDLEITQEPYKTDGYGENGHHTGYAYGYTCNNGASDVVGWAWVGFSPDATKHNIYLTTTADYWEEHEKDMTAVTESINLPRSAVQVPQGDESA